MVVCRPILRYKPFRFTLTHAILVLDASALVDGVAKIKGPRFLALAILNFCDSPIACA